MAGCVGACLARGRQIVATKAGEGNDGGGVWRDKRHPNALSSPKSGIGDSTRGGHLARRLKEARRCGTG